MRAFLALVLLAAARGAAAAEFTAEQLKARFYYDLGPAEIDVSAYPKEQQANYALFQKTCAQCHTLARAVNSPLVTKKDWGRFTRRMHLFTKVQPKASVPEKDAKAIVDFLAYDAKVRKVDGKAGFDAKAAELKSLFKKVQEEQAKKKVEEGKAKGRQPTYTSP